MMQAGGIHLSVGKLARTKVGQGTVLQVLLLPRGR